MKAVIISDMNAESLNVLTRHLLTKNYELSSLSPKKTPIAISKNTAYVMSSMSDAPSMEFFRDVHKKGGVVYCHLDGIDTSSAISRANPATKWMF